MAKGPHHRGTHQVRAKRCTDNAYANPDTQCARCGRTLAQHPPTKTGKPPTWDAGHINDGQIGGPLQPEVATCGRSAGATLGNQRRQGLTPTTQW